MKFLLISNYPPDKQESMKKYAVNLADGLSKNGVEAEIWYPKVFFGYFCSTTVLGIGKWLGYIDKWIVFPAIIKFRILFKKKYKDNDLHFHICDHSNSPYLKFLPSDRAGITCHDVLAIRGALGYEDAFCPASSAGKILQKWILSNLKRAKILTAVSHLTMNQLIELCGGSIPLNYNWRVIHNAFNADFWPMNEEESEPIVSKNGIPLKSSFILHVGSSLPRKNRKMLLDMVYKLGDSWTGFICFAGQLMEDELIQYAAKLKLDKRVISIFKPDHQTLVALYSSCTAFVFPSFSEGFGWPLIEAQACGAPVIASNIEPMPEVSNGAAIHASPYNANEFANGLLKVLDTENRKKIISAGYINCSRFDNQVLTKEFIKLYANVS